MDTIRHLEPDDIPYLLWEDGALRPAPQRSQDPEMFAGYNVLLRHHALRQIFWEDADEPLVTGYGYYAKYFSEHQAFFVVSKREDGTVRLDGMLWLSSFAEGWHAHIGAWFRFKCRGEYARMVTQRFFAWLFERQEMQTLWALTPWPVALRFAMALGTGKPHAVLSNYARVDGCPRDVFVMRLTRAEWEIHRGL